MDDAPRKHETVGPGGAVEERGSGRRLGDHVGQQGGEGHDGLDPQVAGQRAGDGVDLVHQQLVAVGQEVDPGHPAHESEIPDAPGHPARRRRPRWRAGRPAARGARWPCLHRPRTCRRTRGFRRAPHRRLGPTVVGARWPIPASSASGAGPPGRRRGRDEMARAPRRPAGGRFSRGAPGPWSDPRRPRCRWKNRRNEA